MSTEKLLREITRAALDVKALDLVEIDVEGRSSVAEFIVICHGTSTAHTQGIANKIYMNVKKNQQELPLGVEGEENGEWILMDYNSVIVHVFLEEVRGEYQLEELFREPKTRENTEKPEVELTEEQIETMKAKAEFLEEIE